MWPYVGVVELPGFVRAAYAVLSEEEIDKLKCFLSETPDAGDLIVGAGGVRKLRWSAQGKGKRGGARVIYYFHNSQYPVFLIDFFTKSAKADLDAGERQGMAKLARSLAAEYDRRT